MTTRHTTSRVGVYGLRCPEPGCQVVVQRPDGGTEQDGLAEHLRVVHDI